MTHDWEFTFDADIICENTDEVVREDWLRLRQQGIGGSDAAATLGLSPFTSPTALYLDKVDPRPDEDKPIYEAGRLAEPVIAQWFAQKSGYEVVRLPIMLRSRQHPFMQVNVDRFIVKPNGGGSGVLECKNVAVSKAHEWKDGPPLHARLQALHGLIVCGDDWRFMVVACCIGGNDYRYFEIERDPELEASLLQAEEAFWTAVKLERMPDPDGSEATRKALRERFEAEEDSVVDVGEDFMELVRRREVSQLAIALEKKRCNEIESQLLVLMGGKEIAKFEGDVTATFKTVRKAEYVVKASEHRQWSFKKPKEKKNG